MPPFANLFSFFPLHPFKTRRTETAPAKAGGVANTAFYCTSTYKLPNYNLNHMAGQERRRKKGCAVSDMAVSVVGGRKNKPLSGVPNAAKG